MELASISDWPTRLGDWLKDNFILDRAGRDEYEHEKVPWKRLRLELLITQDG